MSEENQKIDIESTLNNNNKEAQEKINIDKIKILQRDSFLGVVTNLTCATLVIVGLYNAARLAHSPVQWIWYWYSAVIVISIYRFGIVAFFYNKNQYDKIYVYLFIMGSTISAMLWGMLGSFLMPATSVAQMIVIVMLSGITAGGIQTLQANLWASFLFLAAVVFPVCIWLFIQSNVGYFILSLAMLLYVIFMIVISQRGNALINRVLQLKYANLQLVENLSNVNQKMSLTLTKMQKHENELLLINQMNEMLQTARKSEEAYSIIEITGEKLFGSFNGALAIYDKVTEGLNTVAQWGNSKLLKPLFLPDECWALRGGHIYVVKNVQDTICCKHFLSLPTGEYLCSPLIMQNEMIGILFLNSTVNDFMTEDQKQVITAFSEVVKLSLANIKLHEVLAEQAIHDPLTGLFNRRYLDKILARELLRSARDKETVCAGMFDLDYFKNFNDKYGHEAGDEVLKSVATLLQNEFRGQDIVCRFGGEEFMVILVNSNLDGARLRFQKISQDIKNIRIIFQGQALPQITVSIGIAAAPQHGTTAKNLIRAADQALYVAKEHGRDRVEVFHEK